MERTTLTMKPNKKFYISVECDTERWYFEHLRSLINGNVNSVYKLNVFPRSEQKNRKISEE
jgi:hypothetical protein